MCRAGIPQTPHSFRTIDANQAVTKTIQRPHPNESMGVHHFIFFAHFFWRQNFLMKFWIHETQPRKVYPDVQLWIDCSGCVCLLRLTTERVHEVPGGAEGEHNVEGIQVLQVGL